MIYIALLFVMAIGLFAGLRIFLRQSRISLNQFFAIYALSFVGIIFIALAVTGRLPWLFAIVGGALPLLSGLTKFISRFWRTAAIFAGLRALLKARSQQQQSSYQQSNQRNRPGKSSMSPSEALEILELEPGASPADIIAAHRRLIQRLHPDRGGSTFLTAQINEAKSVLMDEHKSR